MREYILYTRQYYTWVPTNHTTFFDESIWNRVTESWSHIHSHFTDNASMQHGVPRYDML